MNTPGKREGKRVEILELQDKGYSQRRIATELNMSLSTVQRYVKEIKGSATSGVIVSSSIQSKIEGTIDPIGQLVLLNKQIWAILNKEVKKKKGEKKDIGLIFQSNEQILKQLKLHHDILKTLYDVENVQKFQQTVLETMDEVDPKVRDEFVRRLNSKNIMRGVTIL